MSQTVIKIENLSKFYRLGRINHRSLVEDSWAFLKTVITGKDLEISIPPERLDSANGRFWALKNVSFEVKRGERVALVGQNGAGKSTLLKLISRTTSPSLGRIKLKGRVTSMLEVGTGFHIDLTGRENVFLAGAILGMRRSEIQRKFDEIVSFADVSAFLDTPVKRYSSGMYVRLAFAVASHLDSEIMILDEVLSVGDAEFQKKCIAKVKSITADGTRTILFVSHNADLVREMSVRKIFLKDGMVTGEES